MYLLMVFGYLEGSTILKAVATMPDFLSLVAVLIT